jgi:hypothetical protein
LKNQINGEITWRKIRPFGVLPKTLVHPFLQGDKEAISKAKVWVEKYALTILFTQGKAKGWEEVWVTDDGVIYMNDPEHPPTDKEVEIRLIRAEAPAEVHSEDLEKKLIWLKDNEKAL